MRALTAGDPRCSAGPMGWAGRTRSLRATCRLSALVVAVLWCATPILGAVHAATEIHRYCAQHGTFEEAGEAPSATPHTEAGSTAIANGTRSEPGHEGCSFARFCRFGQVLAQVILDTGGLEFAESSTSPSTRPAPTPAIAIVRLAPKMSPPV